MKTNLPKKSIALSETDIDEIVENLLKRQKPDIDVLNDLLNNISYKKAKALYSHALKTKQANQETHKALCSVLVHHGKLNQQTLHAIMNKVEKNNIASCEFYRVVLNVLYSQEYFSTELTLSLFESAKKNNCLDLSVFNMTLFILAKTSKPNPSDAWNIFMQACDQGIHNEKTFTSMINVIARSSHPDLQRACDILQMAEHLNKVTVETYSCLLKVISNTPLSTIEQALYFFKKAKSLAKNREELARVYNDILTALSNFKSKETSVVVMKIFDEAQAQGLTNTFIYTSTIYALDPEQDIHYIRDLFEQAKENQLESLAIYHAILDAFAKNKDKYTPQAIFLISREIEQRLISFPRIINGELDLHGCSYGETYFWLKKQLPQWHNDPELHKISLICGRGLHSRRKNVKLSGDQPHPVKQGVLDALTSLSLPSYYSYQDMDGKGRIDVVFKNKKTCLLDCRSPKPVSTPDYLPSADYKGIWTGLFKPAAQSSDISISDSSNLAKSSPAPVKTEEEFTMPTPYTGSYAGLFKSAAKSTAILPAGAEVSPTTQAAGKEEALNISKPAIKFFEEEKTRTANMLTDKNHRGSLQVIQSSDLVKATSLSSQLNPEAKPYVPSWYLR